MKKEYKIRKTELKDAEQHVRLGLSVWRCAYKNIFPEEVFIDKENKAEDKIKNFDKSIQNDNTSLSYVAESEGKIVGFVFGRMLSHYVHFGKMGYADLEAIYIHPDYQGLGIGSKLKQTFIDWAKSNGATKFVIGVLKDNHNARKIYEKWGGKLDEYTQPFVKLGVEYDEVFYTYDLTKENNLKGEKNMRLILNGGGSGEDVKESYELFAKEVNGGRVMYIPLAWNHGPCGECIHWFKGEMAPFGITDVDLITDAKQITKEKLKKVSGVFIGGGNTYKLLKYLKETPAFENLKEYIENGGLVMGSSAGALIWGRSIDSCKDDGLGIKSICDQNLVNLQDTTGFDMLNGYSLLVHYKKEEEQISATEQRVKRLLKEGYKLICLPEETSLWINDKEAKIIGPKPAEIYDGHEKQTVQTNEDVLCR